MKKRFFVMLLLVAVTLFTCACGARQTNTVANLDDWIITTGGKKYETTVTGTGTEYYTDGKIEDTKEGVTFSGTGGFWEKQTEAKAVLRAVVFIIKYSTLKKTVLK